MSWAQGNFTFWSGSAVMTRAAIRVAALLCLAVCAPSVQADAGLAAAIRANDLNAVRAALAAGADVETPSNELRPLALAAIRGELEMVDLLLAAGADPDAISLGRGNTLSMAVRSCRACARYVGILGLRATIDGVELAASDGPLVP